MHNPSTHTTTAPTMRERVQLLIESGDLKPHHLHHWDALETEIGIGVKKITNARLAELFHIHPKTVLARMKPFIDAHLLFKLTVKRGHQSHNYYRINHKFIPRHGKNAPHINTTNLKTVSISENTDSSTTGEPPSLNSPQAQLIMKAFPNFNNVAFLTDECHKWSVAQIRTAIDKSRGKLPNPEGYLFKTLTEYTPPAADQPDDDKPYTDNRTDEEFEEDMRQWQESLKKLGTPSIKGANS